MEKHQCDLPQTAKPGDEWTCPFCKREWWADTDGGSTSLYIWWRTDI